MTNPLKSKTQIFEQLQIFAEKRWRLNARWWDLVPAVSSVVKVEDDF
jgi:hypothetical protein